MEYPKFRRAYDESDRQSDLFCDDPSLTQQAFKDEVDINVMLERFKVTGQIPGGVRLPQYGDFSGISDYREAVEAVRRADEHFMELPAEMRARFENDPQRWAEFVLDRKNQDEIVRMGLAVRGPVDSVQSPEPSRPGQDPVSTPE